MEGDKVFLICVQLVRDHKQLQGLPGLHLFNPSETNSILPIFDVSLVDVKKYCCIFIDRYGSVAFQCSCHGRQGKHIGSGARGSEFTMNWIKSTANVHQGVIKSDFAIKIASASLLARKGHVVVGILLKNKATVLFCDHLRMSNNLPANSR